MNTPTPTLTARQAEVLSADLMGKSIHTTQPLRNALRAAGLTCKSATKRVATELGYREFDLPRRLRDSLPDTLKSDHGGLTVKGLETLNAYLRGRRYDPTDARLAEIKRQLQARPQIEQQLADFLASYRANEAATQERKNTAREKAWVSATKLLLINVGLGPCVEALETDANVLKLAKAIAGAEHGYGYVRHLDEADLSAELNEAEQEAHRPGSIGAQMRSETVSAIRAELERRATAS